MNNAENANINITKVNTSDELDIGATLNTGPIELEEDSGAVTVINMPVSSAPSDGDEQSMAFSIDSNPVLKVKASADGVGGADSFLVVAEQGVYSMKETTTPTAVANYGAIYPKADNRLYFQDGAGLEHVLSLIHI